MVVIVPLLMPKVSCRTLATGARQFVVHEAFETTLCFAVSYVLSFTPRTKVASGPSAGAEIITFFTGARRFFFASGPLVKRPVDSTTMSAPTDAQLISAGSFTLKTLKLFPSTAMVSSVCVTLCGRLPRTESYFKRCARVFASVMSLTATNWMSLSSSAVRMMLRPMRPKPLMPTLMGILPPMGVSENCGGTGANDGRGQTRNAMGCLDKSQRAQNWAAIMCADERLVTCVLAAPAVRFGVRRPGPPSSPMDFSARDRSDLLFGVFLARLSDPWTDWTAGNSPGQRILEGGGRAVRPRGLLVRADAAVVFEQFAHADGNLLGGHDRLGASGLEFLAARHARGLFCLLSLVRERGARFFRLPVGWNAAGGRLHFAVPGAPGIPAALG